jgi:hypothetical protein
VEAVVVLTPVMLLAEMVEMAVAVLVGVQLVRIQQELQTQVVVAEVAVHQTQRAALVVLV